MQHHSKVRASPSDYAEHARGTFLPSLGHPADSVKDSSKILRHRHALVRAFSEKCPAHDLGTLLPALVQVIPWD